jgi:TetR/AcrR family fatty acid metabolism transcriptional regulator
MGRTAAEPEQAMTAKRSAKAKEIALVALRQFARKGYAAANIEEIAAEAGIGKSTVYDYHKTKEALFVEAIMAGAQLWMADLKALGEHSRDPMERLYRIAEIYYIEQRPEYASDSKLFIEVLCQTLLQGGAFFHLKHLIASIYQQVVRIVSDYLLEGVSRGQLRPEIARDAETIAINYLAYLEGIKMHGLLADNLINVRDQIGFYLKNLAPLIQMDAGR